jgi:hypothetical protein
MDARLVELIPQFRVAQDRGVRAVVEVLGPTLGVRLPSSNRHWVSICAETGLYGVQWVNGIEVYAHGYGIEFTFPDLSIDFDWGDNGEPDGFDGWRLWLFARMNRMVLASRSSVQVSEWLEQVAERNELVRDTHLYYSPSHRATAGRGED